jgi:NTP pyrophosphatase (non-canonical NTP hydrolase)
MISRDLLERLLAFRSEREWEQFHNLRTLSTSIVLEAAELAEFTQWAKEDDIHGIVQSRRQDIEQEVADLAILLSYLAHDLNINIEDAVARKLELNAMRYPVAKARGTATKYDRLD